MIKEEAEKKRAESAEKKKAMEEWWWIHGLEEEEMIEIALDKDTSCEMIMKFCVEAETRRLERRGELYRIYYEREREEELKLYDKKN